MLVYRLSRNNSALFEAARKVTREQRDLMSCRQVVGVALTADSLTTADSFPLLQFCASVDVAVTVNSLSVARRRKHFQQAKNQLLQRPLHVML